VKSKESSPQKTVPEKKTHAKQSKLKDFEIIEKVGEGTSGNVFKVKWNTYPQDPTKKNGQKYFALKKMKMKTWRDPYWEVFFDFNPEGLFSEKDEAFQCY
jgi:serine/threonine protein kinase